LDFHSALHVCHEIIGNIIARLKAKNQGGVPCSFNEHLYQ